MRKKSQCEWALTLKKVFYSRNAGLCQMFLFIFPLLYNIILRQPLVNDLFALLTTVNLTTDTMQTGNKLKVLQQ